MSNLRISRRNQNTTKHQGFSTLSLTQPRSATNSKIVMHERRFERKTQKRSDSPLVKTSSTDLVVEVAAEAVVSVAAVETTVVEANLTVEVAFTMKTVEADIKNAAAEAVT